jgi:GT2 family glycosyltransferase
MTTRDPAVTVVIPTRHRPDSLSRAIEALASQDLPACEIEVVVVDDGDGRSPAAREWPTGLPVRVARTHGRGAAAARNLGADAARAPLLLFLDDDIEASPGLVRAHLAAHRAGASITIGDLPARPAAATGFFAITLRTWWEAMFAEMRPPGHRFTFRDVLTGNCAIDARLFHRVGGFDATLACHEDYELGYRVIQAGARVAFCPAATGVHHEVTTLERSLERKRAEGRADVAILRKHPGLVSCLRIGTALHELPFAATRVADRALARLRRRLAVLEAARMRGRWLRRLYQMLDVAYWQGVAAAAGTRTNLESLVRAAAIAEVKPAWWLRVDVGSGVGAQAQRVDAARPDGLVVSYRGEPVGSIPPVAGAEPLRGVHLRAALSRQLAWPLLAAMGRAGAVRLEERGGRLVPDTLLPREALDLE